MSGLDTLLKSVKKQMIKRTKVAIGSNVQQFTSFLKDLENAANISAIMDRTDELEKDFRLENKKAVKLFSKNFSSFDRQVKKVLDLLRPALKRLELNISIKRFEDFWSIYSGIDKNLNQIEDYSRQIAKMGAEKIYKVVNLQDVQSFGYKTDLPALTEMRDLWAGKTKESEGLLNDLIERNKKIKLTFESIETERNKTQHTYQEKTILINDNLADSSECYNNAYKRLYAVEEEIKDYEMLLLKKSEDKITEILKQLRVKAQSLFSIFEKLEKVKDPAKKKKLKTEIDKRVPAITAKLQSFFNQIILQLKSIYTSILDEAVTEINKIMKDVQQNLYLIQSNIGELDISVSQSILHELLELSHEKVSEHQRMISNVEELMMHREFCSNATKKTRELYTKIDDMFGIHHAKLQIIRTTSLGKKKELQIKWKLKNQGRLDFTNLNFGDILPVSYQDLKYNTNPIFQGEHDEGNLVKWNIEELNKRQTSEITCSPTKIAEISPVEGEISHNISQSSTNLYRKGGKSVILKIYEENGVGTIEISNPSDTTPLWNVSLMFKPTREIKKLPNFALPSLLPKEHKTFNYKYSAPQSLEPLTFQAEVPHTFEVSLSKIKDKTNTYQGNFLFDNQSDFLVYLIKFELYPLQMPNTPLIMLDELNEDPLEPRITYAKIGEFTSAEHPPMVAINMVHSVQLVYKYQSEPFAKLAVKSSSGATLSKANQKKVSLLDQEIAQLKRVLTIFQRKIQETESKIVQKQESKDDLLGGSAKSGIKKKSDTVKKKQKPASTKKSSKKTTKSAKKKSSVKKKSAKKKSSVKKKSASGKSKSGKIKK
jgi:hypothetical protein